jgi:DNA-binding IclR family transcriptional regulator
MRSTPAVTRAFAILQLIRRRGRLTVPELAAELRLPRSSTHELVQTLVALGCLAPTGETGHRFNLGLALYELGSTYAAQVDLAREGHQVAEQVARACGETVHLASLDGPEVVYIAKVDSVHAVRMVSAVGKRLPAHCTAVGKTLLSSLSDDDLHRRFGGAGQLPPMTRNSITSLAALRAELVRIRAEGIATDNCESNPDVCCVAAPVYDDRGAMVAAMSVSVPTSRVDDSWPGPLVELVRAGAWELSRRLGFHGPEDSPDGQALADAAGAPRSAHMGTP